MKAYKGFDKDLKCRGFQYEVGKEYEEEKAQICECGFHACENPLDVFGYYPPADSRYCEVDLDANDQTEEDTKRVGKKIKIFAEIGLSGLIKAGIGYIEEKIDWENFKEFNTGRQSAATNTGNQSAAINTGYQSAAIVSGKEGIAVETGFDGRAKCSTGCFLVLAEWKEIDGESHIIDVKSAKVDGDKIKPDTFYSLRDGEFLEV